MFVHPAIGRKDERGRTDRTSRGYVRELTLPGKMIVPDCWFSHRPRTCPVPTPPSSAYLTSHAPSFSSNAVYKVGFAASAAVALGAAAAHHDSLTIGISALTVGELKQLLADAEVDFRDCIEKSELVTRLREHLPSMPNRTRDRLDALLAQVGAVSTCTGSEDASPPVSTNSNQEPLMAEERNTVELFERCSKSVVHITTTVQVQRSSGFSMDILDIPQGSGSGFVWDKDGHLVTNFHVIKDAQRAKVTMSDGKTYDAKLVGYEADKDLAVLKLVNGTREGSEGGTLSKMIPDSFRSSKSSGGSNTSGSSSSSTAAPGSETWKRHLSPIAVGTTQNLRVGQKVFAIGNPFGLDQTLTAGIVSGVGRDIKSITGRRIRDVVQTDAAINPGNSGGPLLDSRGRLIGVNTVIYSPSGASSGVGFAIPSDTVRRVVNQIIRSGRVVRAGVGVHCAADQIARRMNVDGVIVLEVPPGSGAAAAGIRGVSRDPGTGQVVLGDVVVAVEGHRVSAVEDLLAKVEEHDVGEVVRVTVRRGKGGGEVDLKVRLTELKSRM